MQHTPLDILNQPIEDLNFSSEFIAFAKQNELNTLSEFIMLGTSKLDQTEGFSKRMLLEYISFLEKHDLDRFIDGNI